MKTTSIAEPVIGEGGVRASRSALEAHRVMVRAALAAASVFSWVFVFVYFYFSSVGIAHAFASTALLYIISQLIVCLGTPLAARLLRHGARRGIFEATFFAAAAFFALGIFMYANLSGALASSAIIAFAVLMGLYRAFYWMPYETEVYESGGPVRGSVWREVLIALIPAFAGLFIVNGETARAVLLFSASAAVLASMIPLIRVRDVRERFPWTYRQTFAAWMAPENRGVVRHALLEGAFGVALLFLWPIMIFLILGWSYSMLGIVLSITFLIALLGRSLARRTLRALKLSNSALLNMVFVISPWILRLAVATPLGIILVDSYFYTTSPKKLGIDPIASEQTGDAGFFVDEYTALKEMSMALGRILMCGFAVAIALIFSFPAAFLATFVLAALLSVWAAR